MINCFGAKYVSSGISFITNDLEKMSNNYELYYLISGKLKVTLNHSSFLLQKSDLIILNPQDKVALSGDFFAIRFQVAKEIFRDNLGMTSPYFRNDSEFGMKKSIELTNKIDSIVELMIRESKLQQFQISALAYSILAILVDEYLVTYKQNNDSNLEKILQYIEDNAYKQLSLKQLAEKFHLNPSYLSRYFKKAYGIGYHEYLTTYRITSSIESLLYTDKNIGVIALEHGFNNLNSYTEHFQKRFAMTPQQYRKKNNQYTVQTNKLTKVELAQIQTLFATKKKETMKNFQEFEIDSRELNNDKLPMQLINLGSASDLLSSDYREHILFLKKELSFIYGRVWNFFVQEMNIDFVKERKINFDKIDSVLDFLVELQIKPFIELGFKIKRIHQSVNQADTPILSMPSYEISTTDWQLILESFVKHILSRYGHEEIADWHFELSRDEKNIQEYIKQYSTSYQIIKKANQAIRIGGTGFKVNFDNIAFEEELKILEKNNLKLDFLSFMMFPYERKQEKNQRNSKQINDPKYMKKTVTEILKKVEGSIYKQTPIYITEWGNSISNRNKLNDFVFKGSYVIGNFIDILGKIDLVSYWIASDLHSDFVDSYFVLNGASGMLSKNGIPKPFFYAVKFLFSLKGTVVFKNNNVIVVKQDESKYQLILHNLKHLSFRYYLESENSISYQETSELFADTTELNLKLHLTDFNKENWRIKTSVINDIYGNLINTWEKLGFETDLGREEIEYIKRITIPRLFLSNTKDKDIDITKELLANEFCLIELINE